MTTTAAASKPKTVLELLGAVIMAAQDLEYNGNPNTPPDQRELYREQFRSALAHYSATLAAQIP